MRRLTKIAIAVVVLVAIYLSLPFLLGIAAQRYAFAFIEHENDTLGKVFDVHLALTDYDRGWFNSTAVIEIDQATRDGNTVLIKKIPVTIKHGPLYQSKNKLYAGFAMLKSGHFDIINQPSYLASFRENMTFTGRSDSSLLIKQISTVNPHDTIQLNWLLLEMHGNLKANHFEFHIDGRGLHFQDPNQSFSIGIQALQSDLNAIYLGDRHWELQFGLQLDDNKATALLPGDTATMLTVNAKKIDLTRVHFDTEEMAKLFAEMAELKQAEDANQPIKATAWMALFQQFLTQMIQSDTSMTISNLSVSTPMCQLIGQYSATFPTLPMNHDYFDVATSNVGDLQIDIPHWTYTDTQSNTQFGLTGLHYHEKNNTVFSRHTSLGFDSFGIKNTQTGEASALNFDGFLYQSQLQGDLKNLSQLMQMRLAKFCYADTCFNQIQTKLNLLKMNYNAFRDIATATEQIVQYDSSQPDIVKERWLNLANAYVKLITPKTALVLSHNMMTPEGKFALQANLSWPTINADPKILPTIGNFMNQSVYQVRLLFPAVYVTAFLEEQKGLLKAAARSSQVKTNNDESTVELQVGQFLQYAITQGYLKKVDDAYTVDLIGKGDVVMINGIPWKAPLV